MILDQNIDTASLGAVLKTALDAVVVMRLDGTVAGWNDVAHRTFGWSFADATGQRMSELIIPHRHRDAHERGLKHYLATGEGPVLNRHIEIDALHRAGHEVPVELSITRTEQFGEPVFLGFLRDISERRDAARRQALMMGELNHRVKNMLTVVAGIAHQTARSAPDLKEFGTAFNGRLAALGRAHEILTAATWERASLHELAAVILGPYQTQGADRARFDGPDLMLDPRQFLSLSMILHELLTNALKYGALAGESGTIALNWDIDQDQVRLDWAETTAHEVAPPEREGFGTKMMALNARHDLHGHCDRSWQSHGLRFTLTFPVDAG